MREALGHHLEACFNARFPREGTRQGGPNPREFVNEIIQELQESRVRSGSRRLPTVAPHPGEDGGLGVCIEIPGLNRAASGPHAWDTAKVHPTAMFAYLTTCRTRLPRVSAS